jgi:hypothetical protein
MTLSNGGFYMAPEGPECLTLSWADNHFEGRLSADAAGIVATLFALCHLANTTGEDRISDLYYHLLDFAACHPESTLIFGAID